MTDFKYPYGSVWISYSALNDLKKCRRLYMLRSRKIRGLKPQVVNPYITLGEVVHETLNYISKLPKDERFSKPLEQEYINLWDQFHGIKGGFISSEQEDEFKKRGLKMLKTIEENPGVLKHPAIRITEKDGLPPNFLLSETENLVLCGNIDWIEVLANGNTHLIDFKTGRNEENETLQLQLYMLLMQNKSKRKVEKVSYWYLDKYDKPSEIPLPDMAGFAEFLIEKGREMKLLRAQKEVYCISGGCRYCREYEAVFDGEAEFVGIDPIMKKGRFSLTIPGKGEGKTDTNITVIETKDPYSDDLPF